MEYTDPLWLAREIINDSNLQHGFLEAGEELMDLNERTYTELNTGNWWLSTERDELPQVITRTVAVKYMYINNKFVALQGAILLPLILYLDGTWLSQNGSHNIKPWMMSIGNLPISVQNLPRAKKVAYYI